MVAALKEFKRTPEGCARQAAIHGLIVDSATLAWLLVMIAWLCVLRRMSLKLSMIAEGESMLIVLLVGCWLLAKREVTIAAVQR